MGWIPYEVSPEASRRTAEAMKEVAAEVRIALQARGGDAGRVWECHRCGRTVRAAHPVGWSTSGPERLEECPDHSRVHSYTEDPRAPFVPGRCLTCGADDGKPCLGLLTDGAPFKGPHPGWSAELERELQARVAIAQKTIDAAVWETPPTTAEPLVTQVPPGKNVSLEPTPEVYSTELDGERHVTGTDCCIEDVCPEVFADGQVCRGKRHMTGTATGPVFSCEVCDQDEWDKVVPVAPDAAAGVGTTGWWAALRQKLGRDPTTAEMSAAGRGEELFLGLTAAEADRALAARAARSRGEETCPPTPQGSGRPTPPTEPG